MSASKDRKIVEMHAEIDRLRAECERLRQAHGDACKLVADMHAAAMGGVCGPRLGVVEDVVWIRAQFVRLQLEKDQLCVEKECLRADAERYRWLRDEATGGDWEHIWHQTIPGTTDVVIDAARKL